MSADSLVYRALLDAEQHGEAVALVTVIRVDGSVPRHEGSKMVVRGDGSIVGTIGGGMMESLVIKEALQSIGDGQTRTVSYTLNDLEAGDPGICGGTVGIFIEPVGISPTILVIGMGHVGKALAEVAKWAGYRVVISDDREEFCNADYLPDMNGYILCKPGDIAQHTGITPHTFIAATTRGLPIDIQLVPTLLKTDANYIGIIGSRRRWALTMQALKDEHGVTDAELARIHAPIGLEIEAETPHEIAISILAEIIMVRRGGTGQPMQWIGDIQQLEN